MKPLVAAFVGLVVASPGFAGEVDYLKDVRPLFIEKCAACHGAIHQEAGLRLDAGKLVRKGGENGQVVDLKKPSDSLLLARVTASDPAERMPPEGEGEPLTAAQIKLLSQWIAGGAVSPDDEAIPVGPDQHWAYQPPVRPAVPVVDQADWSSHPIDALVWAKQQEVGVKPLPKADRRTLLRRVYLDLIGLPPTPEEQHEFLADSSPSAWDRVVTKLLDDPAYGERWGRHWMDVWRYSDWDGYKNDLRGSQRHIWRWRDWIIESLNTDKGYDRLIVEMLAGDEIAPEDNDVLRATGFLARNYHGSNRDIWLDATVEHTAKAFLAMTIDCARCHDHKFDPLSQREYYAMRAIFEPHHVRTERLPGQPDLLKDGLPRVFDQKLDAPTYLYVGGNEKQPDKEHPLTAKMPGVFSLPYDPQPINLPPVAVFPALREHVQQEDLAAAEKALRLAQEELTKPQSAGASSFTQELRTQRAKLAEANLISLKARWAADVAKFTYTADVVASDQLALAAATAERAAKLEQTKLTVLEKRQALAAVEASKETDAAKRKAAGDKARKELTDAEKQLAEAAKPPDKLAAPIYTYTTVGQSYPNTSTGRRLALAQWITHPKNPLTARVAVNHVWMRHFGEPLVENVFDFGLRSAAPDHAQLLDWLAVELMERDWSLKHLHRLIVTSRAYQLASSADPKWLAKNDRLDPDNRFLWKANVRRLNAESIRDGVLQVAGNLDRSQGGADIDFEQGEQVPRRSIYFRHAYEKQMRLLVTFDAAGPTECYRRSVSIIPQQALALANSPLVTDQSRQLAGKLSETAPEADAFIHAAFETVLCRDCTTEELAACNRFLIAQAERLTNANTLHAITGSVKAKTPPAQDPARRARENLVHVLMNHNDFVTVR